MTSSSPSPSPPPTMKAAIRTGWLGKTLDFDEAVATPTLSSGGHDRVLIQVHAAALNPVDYKMPKVILGKVYGLDVCGTVVEVQPVKGESSDSNKLNYSVGDVVMGPVVMGWSGSLAEYAVGYASKMIKLPNNWSVEEGAAFPVSCGTAIEGFEQAGIICSASAATVTGTPESILVIGSSGGTGVLALQLAKGLTIPRIVGICSQKNVEYCKQHGATEVIPYDDPTAMGAFLNQNSGKMDVVYDTASYSGAGEDYCDDPKVLALLNANFGTGESKQHKRQYIMLNGSNYQKVKNATLSMVLGFQFQKSLIVMPKFRAEGLARGVELMHKVKAKPILDPSSSDFAFTKEGVEAAFAKLKSRRTKGKIVVSISKVNCG